MAVGVFMNYKNLKIKNAKFYQAVVINGAMSTYITNPEYVEGRVEDRRNVKLSLCEDGLMVESENEICVVSWNNLAVVTMDKHAQIIEEKPNKYANKTSDEVAEAIKKKNTKQADENKSETVDFRKI